MDLYLASRALLLVSALGAGFKLARSTSRESVMGTHTLGVAIILLGAFGLLGFAAGPYLASSSSGGAVALMGVSDVLQRLSLMGLALFLWLTFGNGSVVRRCVVGVCWVLLAIDWIACLRLQAWPETGLPHPWDILTQLIFAVPLAWSMFESGAQARKSRRQVAIGLAEPSVANRFVLWSIGSACLLANCLLSAAIAAAEGQAWIGLTYLQVLTYLSTSTVIALGFFPPAAYERYIAGETTEGSR